MPLNEVTLVVGGWMATRTFGVARMVARGASLLYLFRTATEVLRGYRVPGDAEGHIMRTVLRRYMGWSWFILNNL